MHLEFFFWVNFHYILTVKGVKYLYKGNKDLGICLIIMKIVTMQIMISLFYIYIVSV